MHKGVTANAMSVNLQHLANVTAPVIRGHLPNVDRGQCIGVLFPCEKENYYCKIDKKKYASLQE